MATKRPAPSLPPGITYRLSLLEKIQILTIIAAKVNLSAVAMRVFIAVIDAVNSKTGLCWLSYDGLAKRANTTRRTAMRSIQSLIKANLLLIAQSGKAGGGNHTNWIAVNSAYIFSVAKADTSISDGTVTNTLSDSDKLNTGSDGTVTTGSDGTVTTGSDGAVTLSIEVSEDVSIHHHHPDGENGSASVGEQEKADDELATQIEKLWSAFGSNLLRQTASTEKEAATPVIRKLVSEGHSMEVIIQGAKRYSLYCQAKGMAWTSFSPVLWLRSKKFLEPWTLFNGKGKSTDPLVIEQQQEEAERRRQIASVMDQYKVSKEHATEVVDSGGTLAVSIEWLDWQTDLQRIEQTERSAWLSLTNHHGGQRRYIAARKGQTVEAKGKCCAECDLASDELCEQGSELQTAYDQARRAHERLKATPPPVLEPTKSHWELQFMPPDESRPYREREAKRRELLEGLS